MKELRQLAQFASGFRLEQAPEHVLKAARSCVLDSIGAALGAVGCDEIPRVCREIKMWAKSSSGLQAQVWGQGFELDVFQALLLNGMMGHALELDDVHTGSKSHIGAVVVTTAWTLADGQGGNGKDFLEAVIVGYEIMARVGMAMDVVSNRKRGWHTTGVIGTFGAAAAAGHLLGLDEEEMVSAFGMAGTQSSGLWAFLAEGATCKKLHPARAAVNGLTAAILAKAGMTGPEHILDAQDGGLYRAVSDSWDLSVLADGLGRRFEILRIDKKPYPCCRTTHHAIDAALALRKELGQKGREKIVDIRIDTYEVGVLQCGFTRYPESPVEAKFSIPYTVAAALVAGKVTQAEFTEEVVKNARIEALAKKVSVVSDPMFSGRYPNRWGCRMTIRLADGRTLVKQIDDISGSVLCPLTQEQEIMKFRDLAGVAMPDCEAERLIQAIGRIEEAFRLPKIWFCSCREE
ncbi:MmgE/PrpD family protein [Clostridium sp. AN503]|uniref:MmgE/PrpD family protein n=1 Tax=Clostridium sp. AN503 TaxID=3160598 RepID=UPI003458EBD3